MKLGTQILLGDGRVGTVVYNSLVGVGIKWGLHNPNPADFEGTTGNLIDEEPPENWQWEPDALLRDPWPSCKRAGFTPEQCVGSEYTVIREGLEEQ